MMNANKPIQFKELSQLKEIKELKKGKVEISPVLIKQVQLFLIPIVTILIVVVLSIYVLLPQASQIQTQMQENQANVDLLDRLNKKYDKLVEIKNSQIINQFEQLEEALPSDKNVPNLINTLEMVQRSQEVIYEGLSFRPGNIDDNSVVEPIKFTINVGGPTDKVISYVGEILSTVPLLNIDRMSLNTSDGYTRANLDVESYFHPLPATLGVIDAALPDLSKGVEENINVALKLKEPPILLDIPNQSTPSGETENNLSIFSL